MGLEEQYPGQRQLWLRYGTVVGVLSVVAQLVFVAVTNGPGWFYLGLWVAYATITGRCLIRLAAGMPDGGDDAATPDWRLLFGSFVFASVLLGFQSGPILSAASGALSLSRNSVGSTAPGRTVSSSPCRVSTSCSPVTRPDRTGFENATSGCFTGPVVGCSCSR